MAEQSKSKRVYHVLFLSDDEQERRRAGSILGGLSSYLVQAHAFADLSGGRINLEQADLVIADVGAGAILDGETLFAMRGQIPRTPLIALAETLDPDRVRALMRIDASDFLVKPVEGKKLIEAVEQQVGSESGGGSRVFAVVSTVGGSGGTSVAISVAEALARDMDKSAHGTCLIDLDFSSAACGYYLDALNEYNLTEIIDAPDRIDAEFLDIIRKESASGFSVFSFQQPTLTYRRNGDDLVLRMLDILSYQYRSLVIDMPYWNARWKMPVLEVVNDILIVTGPTIPSLKQARDLYNELAEARHGAAGITILVNRFKRSLFSSAISKADVQRIFRDKPIEFVSDDPDTLVEAVNCGALPSEIRARSPFVKDVRSALSNHKKRMTDALVRQQPGARSRSA